MSCTLLTAQWDHGFPLFSTFMHLLTGFQWFYIVTYGFNIWTSVIYNWCCLERLAKAGASIHPVLHSLS